MKFVRPSGFQIAEACGRSAWLSANHAESTDRTYNGHEVDQQVTRALPHPELTLELQPGEQARPEALAILAWVQDTFPRSAGWEYLIQHRVELRDPWTSQLLTAGTPDFMALHRGRRFLCVVDWKSIGQWWAGHLAAPDENMQQLIYCVAAMLQLPQALGCEITHGQITLACWDEEGVHPKVSQPITPQRGWEIIERVKAVPQIDPDGPAPEARRGRHCLACYERSHCSAYLLPAEQLPEALRPMSLGEEMSAEQARAALEWYEQAVEMIGRAEELRDLVREQLEAFTVRRGAIQDGDRQWGPVPKLGKRRGPSVGELEQMGRADLVKPGNPGVAYRWHAAGPDRRPELPPIDAWSVVLAKDLAGWKQAPAGRTAAAMRSTSRVELTATAAAKAARRKDSGPALPERKPAARLLPKGTK
jgi:hypothetical protein